MPMCFDVSENFDLFVHHTFTLKYLLLLEALLEIKTIKYP